MEFIAPPESSVNSGNELEADCEARLCTACRHCVEVRGMDDIVCLAHLTVSHPARADACNDFESKKVKDVESIGG